MYYIPYLSELLKLVKIRRQNKTEEPPRRGEEIQRVLASQIKLNRKFQVP